MRRSFLPIVSITAVLFTAVAVPAADWKEPKDGLYTEKQLTSYINAMKENMAVLKAAAKAVQSGSGAGALAVNTTAAANVKANIAKHGLQEAEYQWIGAQASQAWGALFLQDMIDKSKADLAASLKKNQDEMKEKQAKLAEYEKADKEGRRVMTKEDRESAIKSAKDDQQAALDEAKTHADEAKSAREEAEKADADAKQNDNLARNPPADVSADDRAGYIEEKKNAAQSARDAAKEARDKQAEALKAEKESRAKADAAAGRVKNPDLPVTDDEKTQLKQQNQDMIKQLKEEIAGSQQTIKLLQDTQENGLKQMEAEVAKLPAQNVALLKKHRAEWEQIWSAAK